MKLSKIYKSVFERPGIWKYYNKNLKVPNINNPKDCCRFIQNYIEKSEKTNTILYNDVQELLKSDSKRICHIVSTFILGLWFFNNKRVKVIRKAIISELHQLNCFRHDNDIVIEKQFTYVWYMATLFHDLAYIAENKKNGELLPDYEIPESNTYSGPSNKSIPDFYKNVYKKYYNDYRKQKEHGIYAGLTFDRDICYIRSIKDNPYSKSELDWRVELDELYHYVAWIILAHNIWLKRDNDIDIDDYSSLQELIMSSQKNESGHYLEYKFRHKDYPLFSLFCVIDAIETKKRNFEIDDIDIQVFRNKIVVKSKNKKYLEEVFELNKWFAPAEMEDDKVSIFLNWI